MVGHHFRIHILIAFCLAALGLSSLFQASADPLVPASPADTGQVDMEAARAQFEQLWRPAIDQATRSRDPQARITLAEQMLEAARQMPDSPGVQRLTLEQAMELAAVRADGVGVSFAAADMLAELYPEEAANLRDARIELTQGLVSRTRDPAQRTELAGLLVQLLMQQGQELLEGEEFDQARQSFQRAANFNRVARSVDPAEFASMLRMVDEQRRLVARIAQLQQQTESDADDKAAVTELALLLLAEREDVEAAAKLVDRLDPGPLKSVLTILGMKDHDGVTDQQWLETGRQLVTLAESRGLTPPGQATLLTLGKEAYTAFLDLYGKQDSLAIQAAQSISRIDQQLAALEQGPSARQSVQLRRRATARFPMAEAIGFGQSRRPVGEENAQTVRRAVEFLYENMNFLGHWDDGANLAPRAERTTLAVYALLRAGESPATNPKLAQAISNLEKVEPRSNFVLLYRALIWERLGPRYRERLYADLETITSSINPENGFFRRSSSANIADIELAHSALVGALAHRRQVDSASLGKIIGALHRQTPSHVPWSTHLENSEHPQNTRRDNLLLGTIHALIIMRISTDFVSNSERGQIQRTSEAAWKWVEDQIQSTDLSELRIRSSLPEQLLLQRLAKIHNRKQVKNLDWFEVISSQIRREQRPDGRIMGYNRFIGPDPIMRTSTAIIFLTGGGVD